MPTKDELKAKYGIEDEDFEVLTRLPTPEEHQRRGGFLIKLGQAFGAEEWMWKSFWGVVLAIIILPPTIRGVWDFWQPKAVFSYNKFSTYLQTFNAQNEKDQSGFIAFTSQYENQQDQRHVPDVWANGTVLAPISGSRVT